MKKLIISALVWIACLSNTFASPHKESLFYIDSQVTEAQLQNIKAHAKSIDILAAQVFELGENLEITGTLKPELVSTARENKIKLMPLFYNQNFNQDIVHRFLQDPATQNKIIAEMLKLCQQYQLYGIQIDLLNVNANDRNAFTRFVQLTANRLHQQGYVLSIAVPQPISLLTDSAPDYAKWYDENWSGAYDYSALAQRADFITFMLWDRHTSLTTPGPIAAYDWIEHTIQYLLSNNISADKISLGIPLFSGHWHTATFMDPAVGALIDEKYRYRSKRDPINYLAALEIIKTHQLQLTWNDQWQSFYVMYDNSYRSEFLYLEEAKSFAAKMNLVNHYNLRGFSAWKLGMEDPAIWDNSLSF